MAVTPNAAGKRSPPGFSPKRLGHWGRHGEFGRKEEETAMLVGEIEISLMNPHSQSELVGVRLRVESSPMAEGRWLRSA